MDHGSADDRARLAKCADLRYYFRFGAGVISGQTRGSTSSTRSSRGLGHRPFTAVTRVQIPYESPLHSVGFAAPAIARDFVAVTSW